MLFLKIFLNRIAWPRWVSTVCVFVALVTTDQHIALATLGTCVCTPMARRGIPQYLRTIFSPESSNISCKDLNVIAPLTVKHSFLCSVNGAFSCLFPKWAENFHPPSEAGQLPPSSMKGCALCPKYEHLQRVTIFTTGAKPGSFSGSQRLRFLAPASPLHRC